jgi:hypothetical protein
MTGFRMANEKLLLILKEGDTSGRSATFERTESMCNGRLRKSLIIGALSPRTITLWDETQ